MKNLTYCASLIVAICLSAKSFGSVIVNYDFNSLLGNESSLAANSSAAFLTAGNIIRGPEFSTTPNSAFTTNSLAFSPGRDSENAIFRANYSLVTAVENDAYFSITLDVDAGYFLTIDSINFGTKRASANTGPNFIAVRSSLDGFSSDLIAGVSTAGPGGSDVNNVSLGFGSSLQNITTSVELRIYGYGRNAANASYGIWGIANQTDGLFTIEGSVSPIPEHSTVGLLTALLAMGCVLALNRNSRRYGRS